MAEVVNGVKVGDRVRLTCGENTLVGKVYAAYDEGVSVNVSGDTPNSRFFCRSRWTVEVIAPPIPDVVGTIVRDCEGDAWQRHEAGWYLTNDTYSFSLYQLESIYAPLTVLWTPEP